MADWEWGKEPFEMPRERLSEQVEDTYRPIPESSIELVCIGAPACSPRCVRIIYRTSQLVIT